jgi:hypothetical protein
MLAYSLIRLGILHLGKHGVFRLLLLVGLQGLECSNETDRVVRNHLLECPLEVGECILVLESQKKRFTIMVMLTRLRD